MNETSNLDASADGIVNYRDLPSIVDKKGRRVAMARSGDLAIIGHEGREMEVHRLPFGATLLRAEGDKVKVGDRLAEWDPFTMPVITEKGGIVK